MKEKTTGWNRVRNFIKREIVLILSALLAVISCFFIGIDAEYKDYIDLRTLAILFCLMSVMAGYSGIGLFDTIARMLLKKVRSVRGILFVLVLLCFFFSMFVTNDVSLITFVPLTIIVYGLLGENMQKKWLVPTVVLQTIAANLGSMLTPIGNPQNLYLYGKSNLAITDFLMLMLPYSLLALFLLAGWIFFLTFHENQTKKTRDSRELSESNHIDEIGQAHDMQLVLPESTATFNRKQCIIFSIMFLVCLLTVIRIIPFYVALGICVIGNMFADPKVFKKVDYSLLFTFVFLFIFVGNMGRIEVIHTAILKMIAGHETLTAILASQVMSNVPAAVLLSGFTDQYQKLIVGTNLGGLGTLIASMASLISYKYVAKLNVKGYMLYFTIANLAFLALEYALMLILNQ